MRYLSFCVLFIIAFSSYSQNKISTYVYENKEYKVYPFRFSNSPEIPTVGYPIPDGEYIIFKEYKFKTNYRKQEMKLLDTTEINAIVTIKNNKVEGKATFYSYWHLRFKTKKSVHIIANFKNGLLNGTLQIFDNGRLTSTEEYINGVIDGYSKRFFYNGNLMSIEKFKNGEKIDTVTNYYSNGQIKEIFDVRNMDHVLKRTDYFKIISTNHNAARSKINRSYNYSDGNMAGTFYKHYTKKGLLTINLNIINDSIIPFSSFFDSEGKKKFNVSLISDGYTIECIPTKKGKEWDESSVEHKSQTTKTTTKTYSKKKGVLSLYELTVYNRESVNPSDKKTFPY